MGNVFNSLQIYDCPGVDGQSVHVIKLDSVCILFYNKHTISHVRVISVFNILFLYIARVRIV